MATISVAIVITIIIAIIIKLILKYMKDLKFALTVKSPSLPLPLIGHSHLLFKVNREDILETVLDIAKGRLFLEFCQKYPMLSPKIICTKTLYRKFIAKSNFGGVLRIIDL